MHIYVILLWIIHLPSPKVLKISPTKYSTTIFKNSSILQISKPSTTARPYSISSDFTPTIPNWNQPFAKSSAFSAATRPQEKCAPCNSSKSHYRRGHFLLWNASKNQFWCISHRSSNTVQTWEASKEGAHTSLGNSIRIWAMTRWWTWSNYRAPSSEWCINASMSGAHSTSPGQPSIRWE